MRKTCIFHSHNNPSFKNKMVNFVVKGENIKMKKLPLVIPIIKTEYTYYKFKKLLVNT